jgi:CheY-like chemotaxis protein
MLIDDHAKSLSMLGWNLEKAFPGMEIRKFDNGLDALNFLPRVRERLALVILDLTMPMLDGMAVAAEIRSEVAVPIIPITGDSTRKSCDVSADLGCLPTIVRGAAGTAKLLETAREALEQGDVPPISNPMLVNILRDQVRAAREGAQHCPDGMVRLPADAVGVVRDYAVLNKRSLSREAKRAVDVLERILPKQ